MSIELKQVSDETKAAFEQWKLIVDLIHKSEAMISEAVSRVERGERLRETTDKIAAGKKAAIMAKVAEYEKEAFTYLAVVPKYHKYFIAELVKVRDQIEGEIDYE